MTPTQREAALRLWPLIERAMRSYVFTAAKAGEVIADMASLHQAIAAEPVQEAEGWKMVARERGWLEPSSKAELAQESAAEPVAWQWLETGTFRQSLPTTAEACAWRPLYAAPPQRQPLTLEQIKTLPSWWPSYDGHTAIIELVRDAERAHGIGETK